MDGHGSKVQLPFGIRMSQKAKTIFEDTRGTHSDPFIFWLRIAQPFNVLPKGWCHKLVNLYVYVFDTLDSTSK
jgi:hypothetical protein